MDYSRLMSIKHPTEKVFWCFRNCNPGITLHDWRTNRIGMPIACGVGYASLQ